MKGRGLLWTALAWLLFLPGVMRAQVTASIVGTVQDTSGAVIPGAAVTVKNLETGAARTAVTDQRGYYRTLSLPVGLYEVEAEKTGFKKQIRTGINLVVGQEAVVNLNLQVGEVQQTVTVSAEAPIVNTTTASTSGLVGERQVKDLPLNGRSFDNLIMLNPGTSGPVSSIKISTAAVDPGNKFNISGMRSTDNLFLLNGIEYTGTSLFDDTPGGVSGQLLGIDAVREFNVQANTYGAEYGKRAGGQISIVTMSGTNQLHGSAFEFLRNNVLDAAKWEDNAYGVKKPPFRRNGFGAAAGGPLRRDKTFLFGNYEGFRERLTTTNISFVPDANARQGLLPCNAVASTPTFVKPPCAGSELVNVGLAPGIAPYLALWPAPNGPELAGGIAQSINPAANPIREDFGTARVDQIFSEKDWLFGAYTVDDGVKTTPLANPLAAQLQTLRTQVLSLEETHTFSPNFLNTARAGFSRAGFLITARPVISLPPSLSLIAGQPMGQVSVGGGTGLGASTLSSFSSVAQLQPIRRNLFTFTDSIQIIKGKHLITLGGWAQRVQKTSINQTVAFGSVAFNDLQSLLQGNAAAFQGGLSFSVLYHHQWEGAWYAQDTIKVLPNLTINFGLRHQFTDGWNVQPRGPVNYLFGPNGALLTPPLMGGSIFTTNNAKWLFDPRIGLAWDPFGKGKTSIHAGFGTYHNLMDDLSYPIANPATLTLTNFRFPIPQLSPGTPVPPGAAPRPYSVSPPDARTPTVQQWSLMVEQQLTASTALTLGYVGSHGYHFLGSADVNPAQSVICSASLGNCPAGIPDGTRYFPSASVRINPQLGSGVSYDSFAYSKYNALQVDLRQRLRAGVTFRANYTYSKSMDNASQLANTLLSNCPANVLDIYNTHRDYSVSCYDVPHRFSFSGSYDLPIGAGKAFLGGASGVPAKLLGGWKLNGIVSAQTGFPFTLVNGFNSSRNGNSTPTDRPSLDPAFTGPVMLRSPNQWFNPRAFILPPAGTYGNVGRNTLRGPGIADVDVSLFKDTRLSERMNLEFRAEFFNLLNHANLGMPGRSLFSASGAPVGSAGVITNTLTTSRQIQFGLKLIF